MFYLKTIVNNACTFCFMDFYEKFESLKLTNNIVDMLRQWLSISITFTALLLNVTSHTVCSKMRIIQLLLVYKRFARILKKKKETNCNNLASMHCCSICGVHWQSQMNVTPFSTKIVGNNSRITT